MLILKRHLKFKAFNYSFKTKQVRIDLNMLIIVKIKLFLVTIHM